jgi:hypothetical protein
LLEGKNVNLRVVEKEDMPLVVEWWNSLEVAGDYQFPPQMSKAEIEKEIEKSSSDPFWEALSLRKKMEAKSVTQCTIQQADCLK